MTVRIGAVRRPLTDGAARRILGRCALAAIGASLAAISVSTFGADLATGSSQSITGPSQVMHAGDRPTIVETIPAFDTKLGHLAAHGRMVDRLYEELMHWTLPGCSPASTNASIAGRC
jgi:hypothetical protein